MLRVDGAWPGVAETMYSPATVEFHFSTVIGAVVRTRWLSQDGPDRKLLRGYLGVMPPLWSYMGRRVPPMMRALAAPTRAPRRKRNAPCILDAVDDSSFDPMWVPPTCPTIVDWSRIFARTLRTKRRAGAAHADDDVALDIDLDNAASVLRVRAARAVEDMRTADFPIQLAISILCRSPTSHCMLAVQTMTKEFNDSKRVDACNATSDGTSTRGFITRLHAMFAHALDEYASLTADSSYSDVGVWRLVLDRAQPPGAKFDTVGIKTSIRRCLFTKVAQFSARFGNRGAGIKMLTPWSLFSAVMSRPVDAPSDARVSLLTQLLAGPEHRNFPDDGFTEKFVEWARPHLQSSVDDGGRMSNARIPYNLIHWIDSEVVPSAQKVESDNSVLRIITTRASNVKRDLVSSRHVIKNSPPDTVPQSCYTSEFKQASQLIAVEHDRHARFNPTPMSPELRAVPPSAKVQFRHQLAGDVCHDRVATANKLAAMFARLIVKHDVVRVVLTPPFEPQLVSQYWYLCAKSGAALHGFRMHNVERLDSCSILSIGDISLPRTGHELSINHGHVTNLVRDVMSRDMVWPLAAGSIATLQVFNGTWSPDSLTRFQPTTIRSASDVSLPFKFKPAKPKIDAGAVPGSRCPTPRALR